jgi:hypothetical protein
MRAWRLHAAATLTFALLALGVTWPLAARLTTHLPGSPTGDTGVYVWNVWVFRHELIRHGQFPLWTDHIFSLTNGTDLTAHNYTVAADLLALPLISWLGVVGAFNLVYLLLVALSGYATFLLARKVIGPGLEAWIAGAAFAASPVLIARGTAHFSLVAAAPLPIFLLCLLKALETRRARHAVAAGAVLGLAGYCDTYFPIYCVLMAALVGAHHFWRIERSRGVRGTSRTGRAVSVSIAALAALIGWRLWRGPFSVTALGSVLSVRSLYTPVFALTVLALLRMYLAFGWRVRLREGAVARRDAVRLGTAAVLAAAVVLSPVLVGLSRRVADGRFPRPEIYWRSSPPGLDLVELALPNPNHPWFGGFGRSWVMARGAEAFPEFVGSLSLVAIAIVLVTLWRRPQAIPRLWLYFTAVFALVSLGPFVQIARVNTYIPTPWALLRYVPVIELARSPSRFAIVATLGLALLLGFALKALRREPAALGALAMAAPLLLAFELLPAPRPLFDATVPAVYAVIRADGDESQRVLELPTGIRDGTSSIGDFSAESQFFQTVHRKRLIGGYQSRVSQRRKNEQLDMPVLAALYALSEGRTVSADLASRAIATRDDFLKRACIGYVVINEQRTSPELRAFAMQLFDLVPIGEDRGRELFVPRRPATPAPCGARSMD